MAFALKIVAKLKSGDEVEIEPSWWNINELKEKYDFKLEINYYADYILYVKRSIFLQIVYDQEKHIETGVFEYHRWKEINLETRKKLDQIIAELSETDKIKIWIYEWES